MMYDMRMMYDYLQKIAKRKTIFTYNYLKSDLKKIRYTIDDVLLVNTHI